jgi:hypothetical protein
VEGRRYRKILTAMRTMKVWVGEPSSSGGRGARDKAIHRKFERVSVAVLVLRRWVFKKLFRVRTATCQEMRLRYKEEMGEIERVDYNNG